MSCQCHLCKANTEKSYWLVDMKFCKNCYDAIVAGDINKLKGSKEEDYKKKAKSFIGETIRDFFCNGFFGSRNYDMTGAKITKVFEVEEDDTIVIEVRKSDGKYDYGYFEGDWRDWKSVSEHLQEWTNRDSRE